MRTLWLPAVLAAASGVLWPAEFPARRAALARELSGGPVVLFGRTAHQLADHRTGPRQDPNFYYLSGWQEGGATLLIGAEDDILFLPAPDPQREKYTGRMLGPGDAAAPAATGFKTVLPAARFEAGLVRSLNGRPLVYTTGEDAIARLRKLLPQAEVKDAAPALTRMRMVKSPAEVDLIRKAAEASAAAHRAAWKRAAPGLYEYQLAATVVEAYLDRGCERSAYAPIVAAGPAALILHYWRNRRRIEAGELLLIDAGAECAAYTADITRTIPVSGRFDKRQRELYAVVLGAQKAALAALKPGVKIPELTAAARKYMDDHGGYGKYLIHGVSHHIGLEVHDAADLSLPLAPNMVISLEPGIYIPGENTGIRIEDMALVTPDGAALLTSALPREPEQIEKALRR